MTRLPILAAIFLMAAATPQLAAAAPAVSHKAIRVSDLDLETDAGARAMLRRIRQAAFDVCGSPSGHSGADLDAIDRCQRDAVTRAVARLDRRLVTLAYEKRVPARLYVRR